MNFKVKALLAIVAVSASSLALAQNKNFTGFSAGVNANFADNKAEFSGAGLVGALATKSNQSDQNASLQGQYGFGISDKFVVGLGVTYGIGELKAGSFSPAAGVSISSKLKDVYSINIEPGYVVSASTLAYAKVAFVNAKAEGTQTGGAGGSVSGNLTGTGFGVGFRTMLTGKLYLQGEYVQTSFDKKNIGTGVDVKADMGTASIGVGYNF